METCVAGRVQPRQLAFALPHAESLTRDNFLEGPANAAGLTLIDMTKGIEKGVYLEAVRLLEKSGGRSGTWKRPIKR